MPEAEAGFHNSAEETFICGLLALSTGACDVKQQDDEF